MALLDPTERTARGLALQTEGNGQVAPPPVSPVDASIRDFVYSEVWSRPGLDRRSRYLISIAGAVMSAAPEWMIDGYVRGALKSGRGLALGVAQWHEFNARDRVALLHSQERQEDDSVLRVGVHGLARSWPK